MIIKNAVTQAMIPRPPICIRINSTIFPNKVNCTAGVTVTSPVTHTDVTAVKSASINEIGRVLEMGSHKRIPPNKIIPRNPVASNCVVVNLIFFNFIPLIWWFCRHRKKASYFTWLGFKKPKIEVKWWIAVIVAVGFIIFQNIDFTVLLPASDLETMNSSENIATNVYAGIGFLAIIPALLENYIANGLCEEIFFRGFITKRFKEHFGTVKGVFIGAATFALMHNLLGSLTVE